MFSWYAECRMHFTSEDLYPPLDCYTFFMIYDTCLLIYAVMSIQSSLKHIFVSICSVMSIRLSEARMELTLGVSDMLGEKYGINVSGFSLRNV